MGSDRRMVRIADILFVTVVFLFLFAGLVKTVFKPKDINYYENRSAVKLEKPTATTWLDCSWQDNAEAALNDQILFSQRMKKAYYFADNKIKFSALCALSEKYPEKSFDYGNFKIYGGKYLCFKFSSADYNNSQNKEKSGASYGISDFRDYVFPMFDDKIESLNKTLSKYPDIDFYMFYIEKDTDIDFDTGEKLGGYEYIRDRIDIPSEKTDCFEINTLDTYEEYFYQTDHHWNYKGSYKGYSELIRMLFGESEPLLQPESQELIDSSFSGSKSANLGADGIFSEEFYAYKFNYPNFSVTVNGQENSSYGMQEEYFNRTASEKVTYALFNGDDIGEIIFDTGNTEKKNILIFGESYDNAILKLIASHFNRTYSVDLRHYEGLFGDFILEDYLKEKDIDMILLIGNVSYYNAMTFALEDRNGIQ